MSKEGTTREVTKKAEGALAVNIFETDADKGTQNITQEDLPIFLHYHS